MTKQPILLKLLSLGGYPAMALGVVGTLALAAACSSSSGGGNGLSGDDGGTTSATGPGSTGDDTSTGGGDDATGGGSSGDDGSTGGGGNTEAITPTATGYVMDSVTGITGAWYGYGDGLGTNGMPPGNCESMGMHPMSACSSITFPPQDTSSTDDAGNPVVVGMFPPGGTPGAPSGAPMNAMCLQGTGAQVVAGPVGMSTKPDYSNIFGIGIGLDFNNTGGTKEAFDATKNGVTGFSFTISGVPQGGIRVEFPTTDTEATGQDSYAITVTADGSYTANMATTGAHKLSNSFTPSGFTQPAFNASNLLSIQFHVATNVTAPVTVANMCVSNLTAILSN